MVRAINPQNNEILVEIGPGTGILTDQLVSRCGHLYAIELDRDLAPKLAALYPDDTFSVIQGDVLGVDFGKLADNPEHNTKIRVVGNLPYNISTPLIFHLLNHLSVISDMVFMVQKEVAKRLVAGPGDKLYGRLSVMVGASLDCQYLFDVPPEAFDPPPAVDSAVIRMQPAQYPAEISDHNLFSTIVRTAFSLRRKTLRNSLRNLASPDDFNACGLDPALRAEALSVNDFARLANTIVK